MNKRATGPESPVWVGNRQRKVSINCKRLQRVAEFVLDCLGKGQAEISVTLLSDRRIQALNKQYLGRNRPTDVLAFSQLEGEGGHLQPLCLGDVIIGTETALAQAKSLGHPLDQELDTLLVHGVLHLLGYEHTRTPSEAARMERIQKEIMKQIQNMFPAEIDDPQGPHDKGQGTL